MAGPLIQVGDSVHGRNFAATSDVIFTPRGRLEARQAFYADVKARLPRRLPGPNLHDHLGLRHTRKETA